MGLFNIGKMVMRSLFSKPATLMYPVIPRVPTPLTRGHISIDINTCIFCGICSKKCPTGALEVNRAEKKWEINRLRCIQCNCCVEVCPKKCLIMEGSYTQPSTGAIMNMFNQEVAAPVAPKVEVAPKAEAEVVEAAAAEVVETAEVTETTEAAEKSEKVEE